MPVELRPINKLYADLPIDPKPITSTILLPKSNKILCQYACKPTLSWHLTAI